MEESYLDRTEKPAGDGVRKPNRVFGLTAPPPVPDAIYEKVPPRRRQGWKRPYKYHK
jgi:hypothetical protein